MEKIDEIKKNISWVLNRLGLSKEVSLNEIEKEILQVETAFQSLLLLGILRRIMYREDDKAAELFVPAVIEWKNYLPHADLGGLTPAETMEKYPPGPHEHFFISEMMREYDALLQTPDGFKEDLQNVEENFSKFQDEYLRRIPSQQAFEAVDSRILTIYEIIAEEREKAGRPKESIYTIGVQLFAESLPENLGDKAASLDDTYISAIEELENAQSDPSRRSKARVRAIRKQFKDNEPYYRCGPAPHQFYCNYAAVVFLDGEEKEMDLVLALLEHSLTCKPDYEIALEMKQRFARYFQDEKENEG